MSRYLDDARTAAKSARALLALGDTKGAVNRAYYAMFDAARAALERIDEKLAVAKTHATIIRRFGHHVIVGQGMDRDVGRILNQTEETRIASDYETGAVRISLRDVAQAATTWEARG